MHSYDYNGDIVYPHTTLCDGSDSQDVSLEISSDANEGLEDEYLVSNLKSM